LEPPLLPWAAEWGKQRPRGNLVFAFIFTALLLVLSVPFSVDAASQGNTGRTVFGVAIFLVALASMIVAVPVLRVRRKRLPRDIEPFTSVDNSSGVKIYYLRSWRRTLILWLIAGAGLLAIRAWLFLKQLSGDSADTVRSSMSIGGIIITVAALGMILVPAWYLYSYRNRRGFIALTVNGVVQRLGSTVKRLPWTEVAGVRPGMLNNVYVIDIIPAPNHEVHVESGRNWLDHMQRGSLVKSIQVPAWVIGMDPSLFLYLTHYYWQHPESRHELASDAVIDRIRRADLLN
jgi:hypothetical protein